MKTQIRKASLTRKIITVIVFAFLFQGVFSQNTQESSTKKLYDPSSDAKIEISKAVKKAATEGKHVLLQIGGNWCGWCIAFDKKVKANDTLRIPMEQNFVVYHLNYSQENKNKDVLAELDFPQRFGFPVFVILDSEGNRLHTQNSAYLEQGKGHSTKKVLDFFKQWSPAALEPEQYEKW